MRSDLPEPGPPEPGPPEPELPDADGRNKSEKWREVFRVCLNALITTITLIPVLYAAIVNDVPDLLAEILVQAVLVAGVLTKVMQIPMVDSWLTSIGIGREQAGHRPPPPVIP